MADIVIRGMEMPKSCIDCPIMVNRYDTDACALQSEEANEAFESWEDMRRNCPLVPLPEGHGRCIDADALLLDAGEVCEEWGDGLATLGFSREQIENAKTIVPAEGEMGNVPKID